MTTGRKGPRTIVYLATAAVALLAGASSSSDLSLFCHSIIRNNVERKSCAGVTMNAGKSGSSKSPLTEDRTANELLGATIGSTPRRQQNVPTSLNQICNDQREFEMKLGKAVDTLRKDYPEMLVKRPDFTIYDKDLEAVDPSGVKLHGLKNYQMTFRFLHGIVIFFYCPEQSGLTFRLVYDWARKNIRVSWNAILVPRALYGGLRHKLHVDGISVYEISRQSGLITQHRVEHLLINDAPVSVPNGIFTAIHAEATGGSDGQPVLGLDGGNMNADFQPVGLLSGLGDQDPTSMFSVSETDGHDQSLFDREAFEKKNASRKKFGLPPISADEFIEIESQVKQLDASQKSKAQASASAAEMANRQKKKQSIFSKLLGNILEDSCESNWDCERPEVCCDFGFKKMCCSSGLAVFTGLPQQRLERATVPVPADPGFPRGGPDGNIDNW